jgi:NADH:ubiquinone oxidoreductase subunit 3 (subunit A)
MYEMGCTYLQYAVFAILYISLDSIYVFFLGIGVKLKPLGALATTGLTAATPGEKRM